MKVGDVFLNLDPGSPARLWIVIAPRASQVAIVCLSPLELDSDTTCIVTEDEHPSVEDECIVRYRFAKFVEAQTLDKAHQGGYIVMKESCSNHLLRRIQEGALVSDFTRTGIQAVIRPLLGL